VTKVSLRGLVRDEKGQALILALILLVIGGLIMAPLLAYMSTGIIAGGADEKKAAELYAADAGAEDAVLKIQQQTGGVQYLYCGGGNHSLSYDIADVNGKNVAVTITYLSNITHTYQVVSTATGDGSGTKIDAYVIGKSQYGDFSGMLNQIVLCQNETDIAKKVTLNYPEGCGPVENYAGDWPTPADLEGFYWQDVKDTTPYGSDTIDLNGNDMNLGPLYRNVGPTFTIKNGKSQTNPTLKLTGTLYITCDTLIGTTGNGFVLNLNGHTIFVSSNTTSGGKALSIGGGRVTLVGPGAIIAVGDMYFEPKAQSTTDPIFVLSVLGTTQMQPSGDFYGALAGSVDVVVQPGHNPTITYPEGGFGNAGLDFPTGIQYLVYSIASWEVKPA
jgi:hypothetical protein